MKSPMFDRGGINSKAQQKISLNIPCPMQSKANAFYRTKTTQATRLHSLSESDDPKHVNFQTKCNSKLHCCICFENLLNQQILKNRKFAIDK